MKSIEKMNKSQEGTEKTIEEKEEKLETTNLLSQDQVYGESSLSLGKRTMKTMIKYPHKGQTPDCRVQISFRSMHMSGHRKV